jgi:LppX_LprAFG lipoprotein
MNDDSPKKRSLRSIILALAIVATLALAACGGGSQSTSAVDAQKVAADAVPAMQALKSFHFVYEVVKPQNAKPAQGLEIAKIEGDVTADGKMKAAIDLLQNGVPVQVNFVALGDVHYIQDPTSQIWQGVPAAKSPVGKINLNTGAIQILQKLDKLEYVDTQDVGGVKTYHLKGSVAPAEVASIVGSVTATKPFAGEIWIGVDDHLVRRIQIEGGATTSEDPKTVRTIDLSAFDQPVTIEAPK